MRTLVIDTATENCSAALLDGHELIDGRCERLGRGHAERLVAMIAELPDRGRAERIAVALGPGSFTGIRVGIAAARALALAWRAELAGYSTPAFIAAMAQARRKGAPVSVAIAGGHGEWFVQNFTSGGWPQRECAPLAPQAAARAATCALVAGGRARDLVALRGHGEALDIWPDARQFAALDPALLSDNVHAAYGRAPDARPAAGATRMPAG